MAPPWRASAPDATPLEVPMVQAGGRVALPAVLAADPRVAIADLDRARQALEADLADLHAVVQGDRQVSHVRQLQRQVAFPAGIDVARRGVDEQAQAPKRALPFEPGDEVIRQLDALEGR